MGPRLHYRWCKELHTKRLNALDSVHCNFTSRLSWNLGLKWPFWVWPHSGAESRVWSTPSDCTEVSRERWVWLRSPSQARSPPAFVPDEFWFSVFPYQQCSAVGPYDKGGYMILTKQSWYIPAWFTKTVALPLQPRLKHLLLGCNCLWCLHFTIYVYNWLLRAELLLSPKILSFTAYLAFPGNFRGDELSQRSTRPNGRSFSLVSNNQILQKCDYARSSFQG